MKKKQNTDRTRNQRQARRREREKQWLEANGWSSWEALHTALMNGQVAIFVKTCESSAGSIPDDMNSS